MSTTMQPTMIHVATDGIVSAISPADMTRPVRELLEVDLVDVIRCDGFDMWCDDEGLINGQEVNQIATLLLIALREGYLGQAIHGPVLLACVDQGKTVPLTAELTEMLTSKIRAVQRYAVDKGLLG